MRHSNRTPRVWLALAILACVAGASTLVASGTAPPDRLQAQIARAAAAAHGTVGIAIKHLESGAELYINADEPFPMASTFKLPVLIELYAKARAGTLSWDEMIDIGPLDQHLGSGELAPQFDPPGIKLSLHNVANLMMLVSDNSAADICLAKAGAADVNARLTGLGIKGIRVDRPCQELILDYQGADTAKLKNLTLKEIHEATPRTGPPTEEATWAADDKYAADPRDTATPRAFVALLEKIWRGEAVDRASSDAILETMKRCETGAARIKGMLPRGVQVAHKTGSMGGVLNDVGIVYLPDNTGHLAIAIMTKRTRATSEQVEKTIAEIARFAFDYFYFTAAATTTDAAAR
jgi:beta-lactamase class A